MNLLSKLNLKVEKLFTMLFILVALIIFIGDVKNRVLITFLICLELFITMYNGVLIKDEYFNKKGELVRRFIYSSTAILAIITMDLDFNMVNAGILIVAITIGVVFHLLNFQQFSLLLNNEYLEMFAHSSLKELVTDGVSILGSPVFQEIFSKGVILCSLAKVLPITIAVILCSLLFVGEHVVNPTITSEFDRKDLILQFVLSSISSCIYWLTKSLWPCIFLHFSYNVVVYLFDIKAFYLYKRRIEV